MGNLSGPIVLFALLGTFLIPFSSCLEYPPAFRNDSVVDDYHGTLVADPYRWLEDPLSPQTEEFIQAQINLTQTYVEASPDRDRIREKLTAMWNYAKIDPPSKHGDKYFYFANSGLLNQKVLYKKETLDSDPDVFFDPNEISENGTIAIQSGSTRFSHNGEMFAYGLSVSGSDWFTLHFKNVNSGEDLADVLRKAKFTSIRWKYDNSGIFYGSYPHLEEGDPGVSENQKVFFHKIGTNQSEDILIAEFPESPHWIVANIEVSRDGRTIILTPEGDGSYGSNALFIAEIPENITGKLDWIPVVSNFTAHFLYVTSVNSLLYFKTNQNAPNYRIVAINLENPAESQWLTIVEEHEQRVIDKVALADKDKLIVTYLEDVKSRLSLVNVTDGSILVADYPLEIGTVLDHSHSDDEDPLFFFKFESFLVPNRIYKINFTNALDTIEVYEDVLVEGLDANNFETKQVFYPSKDGTLIPMFIVHKKSISLNGESFANLYGYGGFNINTQPSFSVPRTVFMQDFNGVVAIANLRGGGEYGEPWHDAGKLEKKQNVFDDFQSAGEYLIKNNYTSSSKLIIEGRSNGGLLVGACLNQRPDLFGAALPHVGVMDMLRYQLFTIGYSWIPEYGSSENATQFEYIYKYSPLHNLRMPNDTNGQYPPTLVTTSLQDDRVVPAHSLKFAAELQYKIGGDERQTNPLLIRIEDEAGHGAGKPTAKLIEEQVDIFSFLSQSIGLQLVH